MRTGRRVGGTAAASVGGGQRRRRLASRHAPASAAMVDFVCAPAYVPGPTCPCCSSSNGLKRSPAPKLPLPLRSSRLNVLSLDVPMVRPASGLSAPGSDDSFGTYVPRSLLDEKLLDARVSAFSLAAESYVPGPGTSSLLAVSLKRCVERALPNPAAPYDCDFANDFVDIAAIVAPPCGSYAPGSPTSLFTVGCRSVRERNAAEPAPLAAAAAARDRGELYAPGPGVEPSRSSLSRTRSAAAARAMRGWIGPRGVGLARGEERTFGADTLSKAPNRVAGWLDPTTGMVGVEREERSSASRGVREDVPTPLERVLGRFGASSGTCTTSGTWTGSGKHSSANSVQKPGPLPLATSLPTAASVAEASVAVDVWAPSNTIGASAPESTDIGCTVSALAPSPAVPAFALSLTAASPAATALGLGVAPRVGPAGMGLPSPDAGLLASATAEVRLDRGVPRALDREESGGRAAFFCPPPCGVGKSW